MNIILTLISFFVLVEILLLFSFFVLYIKILNKIDLKNYNNSSNFKIIKQELSNIRFELDLNKINDKKRKGGKNDK